MGRHHLPRFFSYHNLPLESIQFNILCILLEKRFTNLTSVQFLNHISMKQKSSAEAMLTVMQDAQFFKKTCKFRKATIEIFSDYIAVEYRTSDTVSQIPDHHADEGRIFASCDELVLVLTYYYNPDIA